MPGLDLAWRSSDVGLKKKSRPWLGLRMIWAWAYPESRIEPRLSLRMDSGVGFGLGLAYGRGWPQKPENTMFYAVKL